MKKRSILCRAEAEVSCLFWSHHFSVSLAYQSACTTTGPDTLIEIETVEEEGCGSCAR